MNNLIDHIAFGAMTLDQGVNHLKSRLGVEIPPGGKHEAMSTHNRVAQTGNETFLEIIAIDPEAPPPGRIRWFSLDEPRTQERIADEPRPLCWVVRTDNLDAIVEKSPVDLGEILHLSRGGRSWRLTVPNDGSLPEQGLLPAFIEWSPGTHPSHGMQDLDVTLNSIILGHPNPREFKTILQSLSIDHLVKLEESGQPCLSFELKTADGSSVRLSSD